RNLELAGDFHHVHRSGPARGDHRELARVVAFLGDVDARRGGHVLVDDVADAPRDRGNGESELRGQPAERLPGEVLAELHLAAEKVVRVEIAQHEVRVGYGGGAAALGIAGGTGVGPRAFGADVEQPQVVDVRDRAAARADLDEIDTGNQDRQAR